MTHVPATPGTVILTLDDDGATILRTPVVAFSVEGTIAYPIAPIAINGLLKAKRALLVDGFVIDRGFPIPFANEAEWLAWANTQTPEEEAPANDDASAAAVAARTATPKPTPANPPERTKPLTARKVFASKSFWAKTSTNGSTEIAEIEPGFGLPRDHEGWEKIKREEFAAFKRDSKGSDATVTVVTWGKDGPLEPEDIIDPHADAVGDTDQGGIPEDDTGLV